MVTSRAFGVGISSTLMIPMGDMMNHSDRSMVGIDLINKDYHLTDNKIYLYAIDFDDETCSITNPVYVETETKLDVDVSRIYTKEEVQANPVV
jgi:hypothetical protein